MPYLLAKTDTRTCIEWDEDVRVFDQILLAFVQEAFGIEHVGWM